MLGTGLTFAAVVGPLGGLLALATVLFGKNSVDGAIELTAQMTLAPFMLGVGFSGVLALVARGKPIDRISVPFAAAAGGSVGLLYFLYIATNGLGVWSRSDAILNVLLLTIIGSAAAAGTLLLARRGGRPLTAAETPFELPEGRPDLGVWRRETADRTVREDAR